MLLSDWHCTLASISVQWLGVLDKIETFSCFSELLKAHLQTNGFKFLRRLKVGHLRFLKLEKLEIFEGKSVRVHNWRCQIDSVLRKTYGFAHLIDGI